MKKLAWGQLINEVRTLHLNFYHSFPYAPQDITLKTEFIFPASQGFAEDWEPSEVPKELIEIIETNPVERCLIEGNLSPLDEVSIQTESEVSFILKQVLMLEREWLAQMGLVKPEAQTYIEKALIRLQSQLTQKPILKGV